jgi:hypothetical protein
VIFVVTAIRHHRHHCHGYGTRSSLTLTFRRAKKERKKKRKEKIPGHETHLRLPWASVRRLSSLVVVNPRKQELVGMLIMLGAVVRLLNQC